jgi:hypothetical protein
MRLIFSGKGLGRFILLGAVGITVSLFAGDPLQTQQASRALNWHKVMAAYNTYIDYPSSDNAQALLLTLPLSRPAEEEEIGDREQALEHIFSSQNWLVLENEVLAGEKIPFEVLLRLTNFTDAGFTESIEVILGSVIRIRPRLFLEVLYNYRNLVYLRRFGCPALNTNPFYGYHPKAIRYELEKRIEALESVKDQKYAEIRDSCIKSLLKEINNLPR